MQVEHPTGAGEADAKRLVAPCTECCAGDVQALKAFYLHVNVGRIRTSTASCMPS
jgi:hypothetical protein